MANKQHTRKKGIRLNRLPNYSESIDEEASTHPGALKFKAEMVRFVAEKAQLRINGKKSSHRTVEVAVARQGQARDVRVHRRRATDSELGRGHS